jgi:hypothetical protein
MSFIRVNFRGIATTLTVAAVLAVLASACGGASGDSTVSSKEFHHKAEVICTRGVKKKDRSVESALSDASKSGKTLTEPVAEEIVDKAFVPPVRTMVRELGELEAPSAQAKAVAGMVKAFEHGLKTIEKDPASAFRGGRFNAADKAAEDLGLEACVAF